MKAVLGEVRAVIKANPQAGAGQLIVQLNPIIRGWANYHRHSASKKTFNKVDWHIYQMMWRWARRKHRKKSTAWPKRKYLRRDAKHQLVFTGEALSQKGRPKQVQLYRAVRTPITRHRKIRGAANPYDPEWELYFEERLRRKTKNNLRGKRQTLRLWLEQEGKCPICGEIVTEEDEWDTHHIRPRIEGGEDTLGNLVLLHPNCHRQVHNRGWNVSKPRPVKRALAEA